MGRRPTQAVLPLVGLAAEQVIRDQYISGGWIFPGGTPPDASRPPVGRTRGGASHPRPVYTPSPHDEPVASGPAIPRDLGDSACRIEFFQKAFVHSHSLTDCCK
ncbi:MAG: hypothetical protein R6U98_28365 [Pirellulaceae bacterium]